MKERTSLLWHYTTGRKYPLIVADGRIKPTDVNIDKGERPAVWFSSNQHYEVTAAKGWNDGGVRRTCTMEQMHEWHGLVRIGVERAEAPHDWESFKRLSGVSPRTASILRAVGYAQGARISEWFVAFEPVPVERWVAVEFWNGKSWDRLSPAENRAPSLPARTGIAAAAV